MTLFFIILHAILCILLMAVILMQSGRGGGLTEGFASAESMFGAKTNEFMIRTTAVLATLFLVTSLALAHFSAQRKQSLIEQVETQPQPETTADPSEQPATATP